MTLSLMLILIKVNYQREWEFKMGKCENKRNLFAHADKIESLFN
jgi:hypothetical protein